MKEVKLFLVFHTGLREGMEEGSTLRGREEEREGRKGRKGRKERKEEKEGI